MPNRMCDLKKEMLSVTLRQDEEEREIIDWDSLKQTRRRLCRQRNRNKKRENAVEQNKVIEEQRNEINQLKEEIEKYDIKRNNAVEQNNVIEQQRKEIEQLKEEIEKYKKKEGEWRQRVIRKETKASTLTKCYNRVVKNLGISSCSSDSSSSTEEDVKPVRKRKRKATGKNKTQ